MHHQEALTLLQQQILDVFILNPHRTFLTNDIAKLFPQTVRDTIYNGLIRLVQKKYLIMKLRGAYARDRTYTFQLQSNIPEGDNTCILNEYYLKKLMAYQDLPEDFALKTQQKFLKYIAEEKREVTSKEIARNLGYQTSYVHKILRILLKKGNVVRQRLDKSSQITPYLYKINQTTRSSRTAQACRETRQDATLS